MANPRKRRLTQLLRQAQHEQLSESGRKMLEAAGIMSQPAAELLKVAEEVPADTKLVEVEVKVGEEPKPEVDEKLLDEILPEKEEAKEESYTEKRKKAIAEKVAAKKKDDD